MKRRGIIWWFIAGVVLAAQLTYLVTIRSFIRGYRASSESMSPTIQGGEHFFVRMTKEVTRGDIVAFRFVQAPKTTMLSRIVGLAGDTVEIRAKRLFINGNEMHEPYVFHEDPQIYPNQPALPEPYRSRDHFGPLRIPANHYFTLSDNRDEAYDGRYWGAIPAENILGRVILIYSRGSFRRVPRPPASSRTPPAPPRE